MEQQTSVEEPDLIGKQQALAIIQSVQKLAGERTYNDYNGYAHWNSGRFPVFIV